MLKLSGAIYNLEMAALSLANRNRDSHTNIYIYTHIHRVCKLSIVHIQTHIHTNTHTHTRARTAPTKGHEYEHHSSYGNTRTLLWYEGFSRYRVSLITLGRNNCCSRCYVCSLMGQLTIIIDNFFVRWLIIALFMSFYTSAMSVIGFRLHNYLHDAERASRSVPYFAQRLLILFLHLDNHMVYLYTRTSFSNNGLDVSP